MLFSHNNSFQSMGYFLFKKGWMIWASFVNGLVIYAYLHKVWAFCTLFGGSKTLMLQYNSCLPLALSFFFHFFISCCIFLNLRTLGSLGQKPYSQVHWWNFHITNTLPNSTSVWSPHPPPLLWLISIDS